MRRILQTASALLLALAMAACAAPQSGSTGNAPAAGAPAASEDIAPPPVGEPPPAAPMPAPARPGGLAGVPDLDRSCRVDSDCEVKNVGNCCGYFPACVNRDAQPDPAAVQAACAASGIAGVCGFQEIQACACVANTCEPAQSGAVAR